MNLKWNKKVNPGLSLIELIIAIFISSIISLALYNSFFVTNKILSRSQSIVALDMSFAVVYNQLEKDISGVFIPTQIEEKQTSTVTQKADNKAPAKEPEKKDEKQKKAPKIENIFYAKNKDQFLNTLSFITCNPIAQYPDAPNARVVPRIVRVVYRLVPEDNNPKSFKLLRQESENLDLKAFDLSASKPIRAYEIANNIRGWKGEYEYSVQQTPPKEQPAKEQPTEPAKESFTFESVQQWLEPQDKESNQPKIPEFAALTLELWNNLDQTSFIGIEMAFALPAYQPKPKEKELAQKNTTVAFTYDPTIVPKPPNVAAEIERLQKKYNLSYGRG